MRRLLLTILLLIAAVILGLQIKRDPGYALLAHGHWTIEMPLWFLLLALIVLIFVLHHALRFIRSASHLNRYVSNWLSARRLRATRRRITRGLIELTEGHWQAAEQDLLKAVKRSDMPVLNYLAAARAAHEQGAYERRDDYLRKAHQCSNQAQVAVSLTQAQLQLGHQQFEQALATLTHLRRLMPHHTYVLRLLQRLYFELKEWSSLLELLPELRKHQVLKAAEINALELQVYQALLEQLCKESSLERVNAFWQHLPRNLRTDTKLVARYAEFLITKEQADNAEKLLAEVLKKHWDDQLVYLYGLVASHDVEKQLAHAEIWLKNMPKNPQLLLALGRLAMRSRLWGKARSYFEASLGLAPKAETYRELGQLLEQLNDKAAAFACYRKGLEIA